MRIVLPVKNSNAAALNCATDRSIAAMLDPSATNTASARRPAILLSGGSVMMPASLMTTAVVPVLCATIVSGGRRPLIRRDPVCRLHHEVEQQFRFCTRQQVAELQPAEQLRRFRRRRRVALVGEIARAALAQRLTIDFGDQTPLKLDRPLIRRRRVCHARHVEQQLAF